MLYFYVTLFLVIPNVAYSFNAQQCLSSAQGRSFGAR